MEVKARRRDLLRGEEAIFDFYNQRLPDDVYDGTRLLHWLRKADVTQPRLLYLSRADLLHSEADEVAAEQFPDEVCLDGVRLALEYHLDPGSADDGVTLIVPQEGLAQLRPEWLGWLVPGLWEDRVTALIRSLPKDLRRAFVPVPETARAVLAELVGRISNPSVRSAPSTVGSNDDGRSGTPARQDTTDLRGAVAAALSRMAGQSIPREALR